MTDPLPILGVDGGGTKTDAALVDAGGAVLRRWRLPGLDPLAGAGWEAVLAGLAAEVGAEVGTVTAVLGMPSHGEIASVSARQIAVARALFGPGAQVVNDVALAFEGGLGGQDGVLVLAGTGSMAWARGPLGTHRVGGWGEPFGDEGSAWWIGCRALALVTRQLDGRHPGRDFAAGLLAQIGIPATELLAWVAALPGQRAGIASLSALVSRLSGQGDPEAQALMAAAGRALTTLGQTAAGLGGAHGRWSFAGSVMRDAVVLQTLTAGMGREALAPILPPVGGAVLAAARARGWSAGDAFRARLQADLARTQG